MKPCLIDHVDPKDWIKSVCKVTAVTINLSPGGEMSTCDRLYTSLDMAMDYGNFLSLPMNAILSVTMPEC